MAIINLRRYYPHYPKDKFIDVPDEVAAALDEGKLPCVGMCLCPEHFLFAPVPLVPRRCSAAGHRAVRRLALPRTNETLYHLRRLVCTKIQPGEILS